MSIEFFWTDDLELGEPEIDADHQYLFELTNRVIQAATTGEDIPSYEETRDALIAYTNEHFTREEAYMAETGYPGLEEHKASHEALRTDCVKVLENRNDAELASFLMEWLMDHIMKNDAHFARFLKKGPGRPGHPPQK